MEAIDPRVPPALMPPGSKPVVAAATQQDVYTPLPSIYTPDGKVVTRWRPSPEDLARLVRGGDVYVTVLTFGNHLQPLMVTTEPVDLTKVDEYGRPLS